MRPSSNPRAAKKKKKKKSNFSIPLYLLIVKRPPINDYYKCTYKTPEGSLSVQKGKTDKIWNQ
jgi:hypothetical protein